MTIGLKLFSNKIEFYKFKWLINLININLNLNFKIYLTIYNYKF